MPPEVKNAAAGSGTSLSRILGLGFGIAVIFGGTVGVGILRLPGAIAGQLGGFYIYSKRAFGAPVGFAVGSADCLNNCAVIAYGAVAAAEYFGVLVPGIAGHQTSVALALVFLFCILHWTGLRFSSSLQELTSSVTAVTFLLLAAACLLHPVRPNTAIVPVRFGRGIGLFQILAPVVAALRAIIVTYDGWYEAIYFTEEDSDVSKHLPKAMIGGVVIVTGLYLLMNLSFLHVLFIALDVPETRFHLGANFPQTGHFADD